MTRKQAPRTLLTAPIRKRRFTFVAMFFCAWVMVIAGRLVWLQVFQNKVWVSRAAKQQMGGFEVAPRRGVLYDRNLKELAVTVQVDSVYAVPSELDTNREQAAEILAKIVHTDPTDNFTTEHQMFARFNASRGFAWVARRVSADTAARIKALNIKGVYFQKEFKRFYPNDELAAQVLGYVGTDDTGLGGLELQFDDDMHGTPGHMITSVDAKRHVMGSTIDEPQPGENLVLSIDANIQYMAERALDAQMAKVKAAHGTVVVQDPHTGQILALAISPRFNPNDQKHMDAGVLTNLAVSDIYEPGSTFKLVAYSAAIDAAGVQPTDIVDCQGGQLTMFGRTLHDDRSDGAMGRITVLKALEKSSDVGAAKMALKVGPDKFYSYMRGYGFGERTGVELPSETRGLLRAPKKWGATSILSMAIGQEVGVTPVQLATMVSAIANGGVYMPPHVLLESTDQMKGDARLRPAAFHPASQLPATLPEGSHRVIKELTAATMREMMRGIVIEGTGRAAALNGYSSGGKTGTANKVDPATHTYSHTKLVASFAGMAPVSNPAITVAVVIDTPTVGSLYGAAVSAPVFAQVAQEVLEYLGVPHDQPLKTQKDLLAAAASPKDVFEGVPDGGTKQDGADVAAMFDDINSLPADDPLRQSGAAVPVVADVDDPQEPHDPLGAKPRGVVGLLPEKVVAMFKANGGGTSMPAQTVAWQPAVLGDADKVAAEARARGAVVVGSGDKVTVPEFVGAALRTVVERAGAAGLRVQPVGSGLATAQMPAAGTIVPSGTEIVVRFAR